MIVGNPTCLLTIATCMRRFIWRTSKSISRYTTSSAKIAHLRFPNCLMYLQIYWRQSCKWGSLAERASLPSTIYLKSYVLHYLTVPCIFYVSDRVKLLYCGLPSAAVLSTALENMTQDPSRILPPGIKTSAVIRNLSVLASQLDSVASSRERNQAFCLQAAKAITEKLDKILDKFATSKFQATPDVATSTDVSPMSALTPSIDGSITGEDGEIGAINLDDYENFDLMSWAIDFDLGNTASDWTMM